MYYLQNRTIGRERAQIEQIYVEGRLEKFNLIQILKSQ